MQVRPSARTLLAVAVLLLSIFLFVALGMELPRTIRNAEINQGNASFHWSAMGAMLLAIVAPIFSVGILLRYKIAAYAFLFCSLYWSSWSVFMVWLNDSGFRPAQLIAFPLLLMLAASAIYFIRTSRRTEGKASAGPSPRVLGISSGIAALVLLAVFHVTVTEPYLFLRDSSRADSLRAAGDDDSALALLLDMSRRHPDFYYLHGDIGLIYVDRKEYEAAIKELSIYCDNAVSSGHRYPRYYLRRGHALLMTRKFERAEMDFTEAIQLARKTGATYAPTEVFLSNAFMSRGLARAGLRNWAGAEEDCKTVIAYAADSEEVERATKFLKKVRVRAKKSQQ